MLPVNTGLNGSDTSYCRNSPVPQHDTYRKRSSSDRLMSVTSGGTALNGLSAAGSWSSRAGFAGTSMTFRIFHCAFPLSPSRYQSQTDDDRSFSDVTTPAKPYVSVGL